MFLALTFILNFLVHPVLAQDLNPSPTTEQVSPSAAPDQNPASPTPTASQVPTTTPNPVFTLYEQYKNDYLFQYDEYKKAYLDYKNKKEVYTKYGTLTTQQEKMDATKKAILARNKMFRSYLMTQRVDLDKYKSVNTTN